MTIVSPIYLYVEKYNEKNNNNVMMYRDNNYIPQPFIYKMGRWEAMGYLK